MPLSSQALQSIEHQNSQAQEQLSSNAGYIQLERLNSHNFGYHNCTLVHNI